MSTSMENLAGNAQRPGGASFPSSFSIISDEVSQDLAELGGFLRHFGLTGFELRSMFGRAFRDLTPADVAEIGAAARASGWRVHACATPVFKCPLDDATAIREHIDVFRRSLEIARALECNLVRVFTFLRRPAPLDDATVRRVAEHLRRLGDLAAGSGICIGVENESSCIAGTGGEMLRLLPALPTPDFGVIWDPCNVLYVPEARESANAMFGRLFSRIVHIHVKDAVRREPAGGGIVAEAVPVGLGDVGWRSHFAAIKRSGYCGILSVETHWRSEQIDERLLHLPAGHAFSRGGEEASRTCLHNIRSLWQLADAGG